MFLLLQLGGLTLTMNTIIIIVTCIVSYIAFSDNYMKERYLYSPYQIQKRGEYYRFITGGFLHAHFPHLLFNMLGLYFFGRYIEVIFQIHWEHLQLGSLLYGLFYLSAIAVAGLPAYYNNRYFVGYRALGASGAVSAVIFSFILLNPWGGLEIFFIPMPAIVYGGLYLWYSYYMLHHGNDNIGHDAHFFGGVYGFGFLAAMNPTWLFEFFQKLLHWEVLFR
jgi:membrane associated rhomboid family serine protease